MRINLETATAHQAWSERWQTDAGRADWLDVDPEVAGTIPLLQERGVRRVLDLGCGVGRHALALAAAGFEVSAFDGSEEGLAFTREAAAARDLSVQTRHGLMTELPYDDDAFDYVLAFNVIYHGDESVVRRSIAEISRVLTLKGWYQGTMLSKRNGKYGVGTEVAPNTFTVDDPDDSDKLHPHYYCDARELLDLFQGYEPFRLIDRVHSKPDSWHWHFLAERRAV
ncbi:MAG: class I SAM-dependent methyltransferase [Pseudomonadota bacterium]